MSYHHFTIDERESILVYRTQGLYFSQIAKLLHRHPSSVSREWKRRLDEFVKQIKLTLKSWLNLSLCTIVNQLTCRKKFINTCVI